MAGMNRHSFFYLLSSSLAGCAGILLRLFALLIISAPQHAFAWGYDEHCATGQIAYLNLNPVAKAKVDAVLADPPNSGYESLALASRWADDIKGNSDFNWARPWHYINLAPGATEFVADRDCPAAGCVYKGIVVMSSAVASSNTTSVIDIGRTTATLTKRECLMFLAHFVGDIHQPLHAGHAADRGGNNIRVNFNGKSVNLHALWDYSLTQALRPKWPQYAEELNATITPEQKEAWKSLEVKVWIEESFNLAETVAYPIPAGGNLDQAYIDRAIPIIDEQIQKGGYRLALLLNDLLK